ncbi:hypothetical protein AGMMS49936_11890 [Endomicrobiia bacterium]|nr:hypothetical protein AGMMS49936_11890 [Endomicrobiia bacterium]
MPFVKGQKRPKGAGWRPETKEKRKKMCEIFDDAFYRAGGTQKLK